MEQFLDLKTSLPFSLSLSLSLSVSPLQYSVSAVDSSGSRPSVNDSAVQPHEVTSSTNDSSRDNDETEEPSAGTKNPPNQQGGVGGGQRRKQSGNRERGTGELPHVHVQGLLTAFVASLKIHKKSNFDRNQLKLSTQHKYMYVYQKKL